MKTTAKDFEKFKSEFRRRQEQLGLLNYEIHFEHKELGDNDAELEYFRQPCAAVVRLNTNRYSHTVEQSAKHEALELLLAPARSAAIRRELREDEANEIFHSIIQCLMRVV